MDTLVRPIENPEAPPKKPTLQERAAIARAAKSAKRTAQDQLDKLKQEIREGVHRELFPAIDPENIEVKFYGGWDGPGLEPYVEVKRGRGASVVRISRLMAIPEDWTYRL